MRPASATAEEVKRIIHLRDEDGLTFQAIDRAMGRAYRRGEWSHWYYRKHRKSLPPAEVEEEEVKPKAKPGIRYCLRCDQKFKSPDRVNIRICPECHHRADNREPGGLDECGYEIPSAAAGLISTGRY